jgi:long-chain acyl-CoA synthetase
MGKGLSYSELDAASLQFASYLQGIGLSKGARVAIMLPNLPQYPVALYGIMRAGYVVVSINPQYTAHELEFQLRDSGAEAIVFLEHFGNTLEQALQINPGLPIKHAFVSSIGEFLGWRGPWLDRFIRTFKRKVEPYTLPANLNCLELKPTLDLGKRAQYQKPSLNGDSIALLQYTGGTTGVSKGAILTHRNLLANLLQVETWLRPIEQVKPIKQWNFLCALPLYHIFAFTGCGLLGMRLGAKIILVPNARDVPNLVGILKAFPEINFFPGVNTLFQALLNNADFAKLDFSQWVLTIGGGMAVQKSVADRWKALTGVAIAEGYGLSETAPVACCNTPLIESFTGGIGYPLSDTELSIRDESGSPLPAGEVGEIYIRGPQVMQGYWNQPEETANAITVDGFFKSGDIGVMDSTGFFRIVDRKKDMITVAGFKVYPNEVEDVVASIPGVLECAVVGIESAAGELVKLFVVSDDPDLTAQRIMEVCAEQLSPYKRPSAIEFTESLPKNNVGKILRRVLRDQARNTV